MKLGGLFSGVGGFVLSWLLFGDVVAWGVVWEAKGR